MRPKRPQSLRILKGYGGASTCPDHVIARGFFLPDDRDKLPQVPVCDVCNSNKSALETELMAGLPFGARHSSAGKNLQEMLPRRLENNQRVHRQLGQGQGRTWTKSDGGLVVPTMTLPIDPAKLLEVNSWIARGLVFFHWQVRLTDAHDVTPITLTQAGEEIFDRQFALNAAARAQRDLGRGTFWYEGAQGVDVPEVTIWRFSWYGGAQFGDPSLPGEVATRIGVMTGPRSIKANADRAIRFGVRAI